jgi:hypothetical protein
MVAGQLELDLPVPVPLVFIGRCGACGAETVPVPAEGPALDDTWRAAEQWTYLALQDHKRTCPGGRPTGPG